jgi:Zn-dependent metalloprotease
MSSGLRNLFRIARRATPTALIALAFVASLPVDVAEAARPSRQDAAGARRSEARRIDRIAVRAGDRAALAALPDRARIAYHPRTRRVRFLAGTKAAPLAAPPAAVLAARAAGIAPGRSRLTRSDAVAAAGRFLRGRAALFGAAASGADLRPLPARTRIGGPRGQARVVRFGQVHRGIPVLGGELSVRLSSRGEVLSVTGELAPRLGGMATRAALPASAAERIAAFELARATRRSVAAVRTTPGGLAVYDARLMGGAAPSRAPWARRPRLVWRIDAQLEATAARRTERRLVLVDARGGQVVAAMPREADVVRRVCDARNRRRADHRCRKPFTRSEGGRASGVADVDAAYRLMGVVDSFYRSRFGRDGIDGRGARMKATVRYCSRSSACPWNNGQWHWSDQQAVFGRGWARADDIVGHEFTHGVLDHEARLFYHYQSGAINESLADIFGELIDLSDPRGRDTAFTRWKIGEDTPVGAFRDMRDPPRYGDADRVRSPRWQTGPSDNGGVHRNSGVGNKTAYLIAAGGRFNGQDVDGIGVERMARLFYVVMSEWLTSASDYLDLGDALEGACASLVGGNGFTSAHCTSVGRAVAATQLHLRPLELAPSQAPICGAGNSPQDVFADDLEDTDSGLWKAGRLVGDARGWYYPPNPNNDPTWDGTWASSGDKNLYGVDRGRRSDAYIRLAEPIADLPPGAYLRFEHGYSFDKGRRRYDGGVVEIRLDGGRWRDVGASRFTHGGYDGRIATGTGNPLRGRRAFTGESHGYGASRIDLSDLAGRSLELRFRLGSDRSGGGYGWYVDDIRVYTCAG